MLEPLVIIIILNTNRRDDTLACLESLEKSNYPNQQVIILDNASNDGSIDAIHAQHPEVDIVNLTVNRGYAGNNNVGIQIALEKGADWVFVLNEDTIVDPECMHYLIENAAKDTSIGIVGPMVYHFNEPGVIQSAGGILTRHWDAIHTGSNETDLGQYHGNHFVAWISGCAILVKSDAINQIGLLDERFFYYWEETDWCFRAAEHGWKILHVPQAKIWHKGVQRNYQPSANLDYYATRNRYLFYSKHHAPLKVWGYATIQTFRTLLSYTIRPKWRYKREHRNAIWQGWVDFLRKKWGKRPNM